MKAKREDLCRCGHERMWHDPCSKCDCLKFRKAKAQ